MKSISEGEKKLVDLAKEGSIFKHYKGNLYEIVSIGRHTESYELHVVYKALYEDSKYGPNAIWIRPISMFFEKVFVDGEEILRFERIV
ncbi:MAG: DUF1653 domain-containing protein [Chlamydiae bacterium]|nr:DUF1653 domain-containing protein [Chlamydiota bacterium]